LRSLDSTSKDIAPYSSKCLALLKGNSFPEDWSEVFPSPAGTLKRLNKNLEFIPLTIDRFVLEFAYDVRDGSPCGHQFVVIINEYKDVEVTHAIGLTTCNASEADDSGD
jgi:hypothetical protein